MQDVSVSFIIPVYNVEKYLRQSVESIASQTYRSIEIILVDDGSPDGCPALCDKLAAEDERIKVLHKSNGGLSDARNAGLQMATGVYVVFVDGDDFWRNADDLAKLVEVTEKNPAADFIGFNCEYYYPESETYTKWVAYDVALDGTVDKNLTTCALVASGTFPMSACLKLLKREFLIKNELFFVKGQIAEDIPWFINVLDKCSNCCFVNQYVYAYRQNVSSSITNSGGDRSFKSLFNIFKTELAAIDSRSFSDEAKAAIKSFLAYEYSILLTYKGKSKEVRKRLYQYKDVLQYTMNPKVKMVSKVYNLFGIRITEWVLDVYQMKRKAKK